MELYQLDYFRKLCEFQSFSKTAEYFHVTQPAVSIAVKKLEEELGGKLLRHDNKTFTLSPMGQEFLYHVNKIHLELENMYDALEKYSDLPHKVIRIGMPLSIYSSIATAIADEFVAEHPEIPVYLSHTSPEYVSEAILLGNLDMGIALGEVPDKIQKITLESLEFYAYVSPEHKLYSCDYITPEMLEGEQLLVSREPYGIGECLHKYFEQYDFEAKYLETGNLLPLDAFNAAMQGKGIAFLDKNLSSEHYIPMEPPLYIDMAIIWSKDKVLTKDQRVLVDFILSRKLK